MTLSKAAFAEHLFNEMGLNKQEARELVDLFFKDMKETLEQGEPIKLSGFGSFDLRDKDSRPGRNPQTGEAVPISARRIVSFKAAKKLKLQVSQLLDRQEHA